jgi:hypothetical protein
LAWNFVINRRFQGINVHGARQALVGAILIAGIVCLFAGGGSAKAAGASGAAADGGARRAFVTHHGRNWSWAGPANWHAGYGTYGITVYGTNNRVLDLGFSSTFCVPANSARQSAERYMARARRQLRQNGTRITSATRVRHVRSFGPNYFRQIVRGTANRGRLSGVAIFDYEVARYCYQRSVAMGAPTRGFSHSLNLLFRVFNSLAYSGPGAYETGNGVHGT